MASFPPIYNPSMPFQSAVLGGICDGKKVTIQGLVHSHCTRFAVNFICFNNDIAFHFNPRFDDGHVIVCNTMQSSKWGSEERTKHMPFNKNGSFEIAILVLGHAFQVSVNGQYILEYRHRVSYQSIQSIQVNGDVSLSVVTFTGPSFQTHMSPFPPPYSATPNYTQNPFMTPAYTAPLTQKGPMTIYNPTMPFQAALQGTFTKNRKIIIVGNVPYGADRFHVNLLNSGSRNIYLHVAPRFKEGALVRNTQDRGTWGPEERHMSYMPFVPGQQFQMEIRNEGGCFGVSVNSAKVFTYVHRLPGNQIDMMEVAGDVTLTYIQF
uniref:Galectin n=1 Tax=Xenopus tropicalis TaxID=8364 RepID=F7B0Q4_XENTR